MGDLILKCINTDANLPHLTRAQELAELPSLFTIDCTGLWSGTFLTGDSRMVTVVNGLITGISALPGVTGIPVISTPDVYAKVGTALSVTLAATHTPTSWLMTGLPAGLTYNTSTGVISGTPTNANELPGYWYNDITIQVFATNATGTGTAFLVIHVLRLSAV